MPFGVALMNTMSEAPTLEDCVLCGRCPIRRGVIPTREGIQAILLNLISGDSKMGESVDQILALCEDAIISKSVLRQDINPNG